MNISKIVENTVGTALVVVVFAVGCKDEKTNEIDPGEDGPLDSGVAQTDDCGFVMPGVIPVDCQNNACHEVPPVTTRHPQNNLRCYRCHGYVVDETYTIIEPPAGSAMSGLHMNGQKDYAVGCSSCHGWDQGMSPPQSLSGVCTAGEAGVGAHRALRYDAIPAHRVACSNCHRVPLLLWDEGHVDGDGKAEVVFNHLAKAQGAAPVWDGQTCQNVYCHGATLEGGTHKEPNWFDTSGQASECGTCHRLTDPSGNPDADCHQCHPTSVLEDGTILPMGDHVNGEIDLVERI